jgi:hypothetical protein
MGDCTGKNGEFGRGTWEKWGTYHGFTREKWRSGDVFLCF